METMNYSWIVILKNKTKMNKNMKEPVIIHTKWQTGDRHKWVLKKKIMNKNNAPVM